MALLDDVKTALRVNTLAYDNELTDLIESAKLDLGIAGVVIPETMTEVVSTAVKTYCKMNFGTPSSDVYDRLKSSYDEQKAQLSMASGYTNFGGEDE